MTESNRPLVQPSYGQSSYYIETSQLIYITKQVTGFNVKETVALNVFQEKIRFKTTYQYHKKYYESLGNNFETLKSNLIN